MTYDDAIILAEYSLEWPKKASEEISKIKNVVSHSIIEKIEHIGSTAVPGCSAKPIIDIAIEVRSIENAQIAIQPLESMGYIFWNDNPDKSHMFFVKGMPPYGKVRTHHVHFFETERFKKYIQFRDLLIQEPELLKNYQTLKKELAIKYKHDREAYTNNKTEFIQRALTRKF